MVKVYVAGPLSQPPHLRQLNVDKAIALGAELVVAGYNPYVPHTTHYLDQVTSRPVDYETWLAIDFEWLEQCDVLFRMEGHSPGADREVARAEKLKIPVVRSLAELAAFRDCWEHLPKAVGNAELRDLWRAEYRPRVLAMIVGAARVGSAEALKRAGIAAPGSQPLAGAAPCVSPSASFSEQRRQVAQERQWARIAVAREDATEAAPPGEVALPRHDDLDPSHVSLDERMAALSREEDENERRLAALRAEYDAEVARGHL